jgi:hypothetical protein
VAEQLLPHHRVNAIGANYNMCPRSAAMCEVQRHTIVAWDHAAQLVPSMNYLLGNDVASAAWRSPRCM